MSSVIIGKYLSDSGTSRTFNIEQTGGPDTASGSFPFLKVECYLLVSVGQI